MAEASVTSVDAYCAVRDQGQESQLVDQEQRSDNGTEDATIGSTLGSRTGGELLEVPDAGYRKGTCGMMEDHTQLFQRFRCYSMERPAIGHLERIERERPDTPTAVYGFPAREGFHEIPGQGSGPEPFDLPSTYIRGTTVIV